MLDVFLLSFGQELRPLGADHKFLHFIFTNHFCFLEVFWCHLRNSVFHQSFVVGVRVSGYILGDLVAELEVGYLEVHLGDVCRWLGALLELVGHVRAGLFRIGLTVHLGLLTNMEIWLPGHLDHFFPFSSFLDHEPVVSCSFVLRLLYQVLSIALFRHLLVVSQAEMSPIDLLFLC